MKKIVLLLLACFLLTGIEAFPKITPDKLRQAVQSYVGDSQGKKLVTMPILKSATMITYGFSNGSVAPEYAYAGYINVTPEEVSMVIYHDSSVCYSESKYLSAKEYAGFLNELYSLGIKENSADYAGLCGAPGSDITIKKGDKKIFSGSEDEDIVTSKGSLSDPFVKLLDESMLRVYEDPESTYNGHIGIYTGEDPELDL